MKTSSAGKASCFMTLRELPEVCLSSQCPIHKHPRKEDQVTGGGQTPTRMCMSFCFASVASRPVTRFGAAPLIGGSAADTRDAQPDSSRRGTPSEPRNSGTAALRVTTGEDHFLCRKVVVFVSQISLARSLVLTSLLSPSFISDHCPSPSLTVQSYP